ncbi:MAG: response regulator [Burkholderiaceae bacterium]|nr:response regulator [Burkholderiaceae bacterium]
MHPPADDESLSSVSAPHALRRGLLRAVLLALLCAALQALLPRYPLGVLELPPLALVLGITVAAAMSRGRWTLPAAVAGMLVGGLLAGTAPAPLALEAGVLGLQAMWVGWRMRHGADAQTLQLDDGPRLRRLALGVAPVAALLGALASLASALWLTDLAGAAGSWRALLAGATGRWVSDLAGIVAVAPVLLCWLGRPPAVWRERRRAVALPLLLLMAVMLPGFDQVARRDATRLQVRFDREAAARQLRLQQLLAEPLDAAQALRGMLAAAGDDLPPAVFDRLADGWLQRAPGLLAVGWLQEPAAAAAPALQHGHATVAEARAALAQALAGLRGAEVASAGDAPRLLPAPGAAPALLLLQAVPALDGGAPRRWVAALVDVQRQLALAWPAGDDPNVRLCLFDATAPATAPATPAAAPRLLAGPPACERNPTAGAYFSQVSRLSLGERRLDLLVIEPPTADNRLFTAVWLLALPTVLGMAMLATLLLALTGRIRRIEDRVRERTAALNAEIDERRATERRLLESEQRFRAMFDGVSIGVTLVDTEGRLTMVNPAFARMMGYDSPEQAAELVGKPLSEIRLPDVEHDDGTAEALGGEGARRQRYLTADGRVLQVAASLRSLHDAHGAPVATVGALQDLTQVLRLREAERERDEAAVANRTKTEFMARLSHELRAPLNAIVGFAQRLGEAEVDEVQRSRQLLQIRQAGWHLLDMINDVLDLSRMEAGSLRLQLEPVALPELVQEALAMVEPAAQQAGVALELSLSPQVEWVQADATRLRQVLVNLLGNAVKYNRRGGRVELRTRPAGMGELLIEVEDSGIGIPEDKLDELFTPFHRLGRDGQEGPAAGGQSGTGIGLVVCRKLVGLMGGELEVSSRLGQGSVFGVRLPRPAGEPPAGAAAGTAALAVLSSYTAQARSEVSGFTPLQSHVAIGQVLCIEDDEADVAALRQLLQQRPGVTLEQAASGAAGLARAAQADLILLDLDLPDRPGLDVLRALQADARTRDIPVLVVSAETRPQRIDECFDAGATQFLSKPLDAQQLLRAIDELLR